MNVDNVLMMIPEVVNATVIETKAIHCKTGESKHGIDDAKSQMDDTNTYRHSGQNPSLRSKLCIAE